MNKNSWPWLLIAGFLLLLLFKQQQRPAIQQAHNKEVWKWTDYKGQSREIVVSREVEVRT